MSWSARTLLRSAWSLFLEAWLLLFQVRQRIRPTPSLTVLVIAVYRNANTSTLTRLLREAQTQRWQIRLWGLDEPPSQALAPWTSGQGPGTKFELLTKLLCEAESDRFDWVIVLDDDLELLHGSLRLFIELAERSGLDLVQAGHDPSSHVVHSVTVRRALSIVRRTAFIEIGPLFAVRKQAIQRALAGSMHYGMGWGLEVKWSSDPNLDLGVVDAVVLNHLNPIAASYDRTFYDDQVQKALSQSGTPSIEDLQITLETWRPWQRRPPWRINSS